MKVVLAKTGPAVSAPSFLRAVIAIDLVVGLAVAAAGALEVGPASWYAVPWSRWAVLAFGLLVVAADLFAARLLPKALAWRRRLGYLAIVAVVWRGGPFQAAGPGRVAGVVALLYTGLVWTALVTGGRALSRAIASSTGEDKPE